MSEILPPDEPAGPGHDLPSRLPRSITLFLSACLLLTLLEAGAYLAGGWAAWFTARLWGLSAVAFVLLSALAIVRAVLADVRRGRVGVLVLAAATVFVAFHGIGNVEPTAVSPESTPELASALTALNRPDLGYTGTGPWGSPARQLILPAVPSLLMGRSVLAFRLGYAGLFVLGMLLCWTGLRASLSSLRQAGDIAALTVLSFLSFPLLVESARLYTRIGLPATLAMLAIGWLFLAGDRPSAWRLAALAWIGCLLGTSSPPGLAGVALLVLFVATAAIIAARRHDGVMALAWGGVIVPIAAFTGCSFLVRGDMALPDGTSFAPSALWSALETVLRAALPGQPQLFLSPLLLFPILVYLIVALVGGGKLHDAVLAWWVVIVLFLTVVAQRHTGSRPEAGLSDALVVIPPLVIAMLLWALRVAWGSQASRLPRPVLAGAAVVLVATTVLLVHNTDSRHHASARDVVYSHMAARAAAGGVTPTRPPTLVLLTGGVDPGNSNRYISCFSPGYRPSQPSGEPGRTLRGPTLGHTEPNRWPPALQTAAVEPPVRLDIGRESPPERIRRAIAAGDIHLSSVRNTGGEREPPGHPASLR